MISSGNQALINEAFRKVLKARGLAAVAQAAGLTREGPYKALRPSSRPRFETLAALLDAPGMTIKIVPKVTLDNSDAKAA